MNLGTWIAHVGVEEVVGAEILHPLIDYQISDVGEFWQRLATMALPSPTAQATRFADYNVTAATVTNQIIRHFKVFAKIRSQSVS